jgi:hypothetical protein
MTEGGQHVFALSELAVAVLVFLAGTIASKKPSRTERDLPEVDVLHPCCME